MNEELKIVFSDNHLLIVEKPSGMPTQSHASSETSLEQWAKSWVKETFSKPGEVFLEPIHRLDKPVSGLVLFARTSKALSRLQAMMRDRKIIKKYYALVEKSPAKQESVLEHYLLHEDFYAKCVDPLHPGAKKAILEYKVLEIKGKHCFLEVKLITGRYHQIRAQMAAIGCPIVGDIKYGSKVALKEDGIALHHGKMEFEHPITHKLQIFESNIKNFELLIN